ncbi:MAG: hypothetical protein PQJ58_17405, partial [Spirochaetales bacterium]|nr:hypothetical protein [Spirochaetales bacterium]
EVIPEPVEDYSEVPVLSYDEPLPVPSPEDSLRVDRGSSEDIVVEPLEEPVETAAVPDIPDTPEDLFEEFPGDESDTAEVIPDFPLLAEEVTPEEDMSVADALDDVILPTGDNVIYFLTPSDFRPPSGPVKTDERSEEIIPVLVDRDILEDYIVSQLEKGSSYIQLGAYSTSESIYSEIEAIEARYPMIVWTESRGGAPIYKLLIGPLTEDETGVLTYRFRDSGYADLFLYRP